MAHQQTLTINGVDYFVQSHGQGPPLVLLHGFTGNSTNWVPFIPHLAPHYHLIIPDILGHGRSASPPSPHRYQMPQVAADIVALVRHFTVKPANWLGYSMGGRLALYIAATMPDQCRTLILESTSPGLETAVSRQQRTTRDNALAQRILDEGIESFVNFWEGIPLFASQQHLSPETRLSLRQQRLSNTPLGLANSLRGMGTGQQPNLWPQLPHLTLPTLLLTGTFDHKFVAIAQRMTAQLPHAQHHTIANAGHTLHLEQPNLFNQHVYSFLQ